MKLEIVYNYNATKAGVDKIDSLSINKKVKEKLKKIESYFFFIYLMLLRITIVLFILKILKKTKMIKFYFYKKIIRAHICIFLIILDLIIFNF